MKKIKCECGHVNPEGTVLCEACGKPVEENQHIDGNDHKKLLNMRYEGTARRSKTYTSSIIDKVWAFFSSVKVGVWLIVTALIASSLGTIFPQEIYIPADAPSRDPAVYYEASFGIIGKIYYQLGLYEVYSSWWYMIIIAMIGISLVICSIDRFVPLHRALKIQKSKRHESFINRQRLYSETEKVTKEETEQVIEKLKKQRYNVRVENGHVLAEKGRFSRWGPYVNHIGLIIILIGAIFRMTSFMYLDEYVWIRDDQQMVIPGTHNEYFIENKGFTLETYDITDERFKETLEKQNELIAKNYQTDLVIYRAKEGVVGSEPALEKIIEDEIRMNHPLKFDGYTLYQAGYQLNEFTTMSFKLYDQNDPDQKAIDVFTVDLTDPSDTYELENGFRIELADYFPDYYLDNGEPRSRTKDSKNPAFIFRVYPPDEGSSEVSFLGIGQNVADEDNQYKLALDNYDMHNVSGITVRRDHTLPIFIVGALIFMIGVVQGMYWQHRRIWIHPKNDGILLAAHTNKNWFGIQADIEKVIENTNVNMVEDRQALDE